MIRNKQIFFWIFLIWSTVFSRPVSAQQKKNIEKADQIRDFKSSVLSQSANLQFDCNLDWASPIGGSGFFTKEAAYYHFAQLANKKVSKPAEIPQRKYGLYKIDLKSMKSKLLMTLNLPETISVIPHGDPLTALVVLVFNHNPNHCLRGSARYISFPIQKRQKSKGGLRVIQGKGDFQTVRTAGQWRLYDFSRSNALEFDFGKYQVRTSYVKTKPNEILLYLDSNRNRYYTWQPQATNSKRGLVAYEGQEKMAGGVIFAPEDKLIHQKNLFGVTQFKKESHSIDIIELGRWSGRADKKAYTIYVPKIFDLERTHLKINFAKKIVTIAASVRQQRKKVKNIAIFDYEKSWLLSSYSAPKNQYAAYEAISPDGGYVVVESKNKVTEQTMSLSVYSIGTRKWNRIYITK